ncbi:MAG TPA: hypothetical protein VHJ20_06620 [Polyangia bacterium]|nr:hypothetical protein [Polyangia bacterium]
MSAYAEPGDAGERVWFFPTAEGTAPEVEAGEAPRIFDRAVAARSLRAGAYQIHALLASRRLSREEILAASDESILARQTTRLEVGP